MSGGEYQKVAIGNGTFYIGDCFDVMRDLPDGSVDMVVTSPPYDDMRTYNGTLTDWSPAKWNGVIGQLQRLLVSGGVAVWVVGDQTRNHSESGSSFRQALSFMDAGFNLFDTMIYEKAQACFGSNLSYLQCFEYMFVFSKGRPSSVNLIYDRANVRGGKAESTVKTGPSAYGFNRTRHIKEFARLGRRKNIWKYGVGGGDTGHPAVFPLTLASDHIVSWSNEGQMVLDPFGGSGTTAIAAENAGRRWICIERDPEYAAKAIERIRAHVGETASLSPPDQNDFDHLFS